MCNKGPLVKPIRADQSMQRILTSCSLWYRFSIPSPFSHSSFQTSLQCSKAGQACGKRAASSCSKLNRSSPGENMSRPGVRLRAAGPNMVTLNSCSAMRVPEAESVGISWPSICSAQDTKPCQNSCLVCLLVAGTLTGDPNESSGCTCPCLQASIPACVCTHNACTH